MAWIRDTDEKAQRRPADIAMLVVAGILAVLVGLWAQTQSTVNANLFATVNDLSGNMVGLAKAVYALGSIWAVLAVTVVLLVDPPGARGMARRARGGGGVGHRRAAATRSSAPTTSRASASTCASATARSIPVVNVAVITALAFALSPYLVRPLRRIFGLVILLVSLAAMYLGAGFPADVLGGILRGLRRGRARAGRVRLARRAALGRPRSAARSPTWATT